MDRDRNDAGRVPPGLSGETVRQWPVNAQDPRIGICALPRPQGLAILNAQLAIFRSCLEQGIPITIDSIARLQTFARALELMDLKA